MITLVVSLTENENGSVVLYPTVKLAPPQSRGPSPIPIPSRSRTDADQHNRAIDDFEADNPYDVPVKSVPILLS